MKNDINHKLEMYGANILIVPKTENLSLTYGGLSLGGVSFDMTEIRQDELDKIKAIKIQRTWLLWALWYSVRCPWEITAS